MGSVFSLLEFGWAYNHGRSDATQLRRLDYKKGWYRLYLEIPLELSHRAVRTPRPRREPCVGVLANSQHQPPYLRKEALRWFHLCRHPSASTWAVPNKSHLIEPSKHRAMRMIIKLVLFEPINFGVTRYTATDNVFLPVSTLNCKSEHVCCQKMEFCGLGCPLPAPIYIIPIC